MRIRKRGHGGEPGGAADAFQPRLWVVLAVLVVVVAYSVAFVVANDAQVSVSFVFASTTTSPIWVLVLSLMIGVLVGVLLAQLYRRRSSQRSEASSATPSRMAPGDS